MTIKFTSNLTNVFVTGFKQLRIRCESLLSDEFTRERVKRMGTLEESKCFSSANDRFRQNEAVNLFPTETQRDNIFTNAGRTLYIAPAVFVLSALIVFSPDLRNYFNQTYSGQVPIIMQILQNQVRTGALGQTLDSISDTKISDHWSKWVEEQKLEGTLFDLKYLSDHKNDAVSFISRCSGYLPSCDFVPRSIGSKETITQTGLSVSGGPNKRAVEAHPGASFPFGEINALCFIPALFCGQRLYKVSDGTPYTFSDSGNTVVTATELQPELLIHFIFDVTVSSDPGPDSQPVETKTVASPTVEPAKLPQVTSQVSPRRSRTRRGDNLKAKAFVQDAIGGGYSDVGEHQLIIKLVGSVLQQVADNFVISRKATNA